MIKRLYLYWRWFRRSRVKVRRAIQSELPAFSRISDQIAGDNFPVLKTI